MTARWRDLPITVLSSPDLWRSSRDYYADREAYRLWAQVHRLPDTLPYTEKVYAPG